MSDKTSISLLVPSIFVVPQKKPPGPPPLPGTVEPEDLRPPVNPPRPFLRSWKSQEGQPQGMAHPPLKCKVDAGELKGYLERHDVERTLKVVFKEREDCEEMVQDVMTSMADPFRGNDSSIVWTHVPVVRPNPDRDARLGGKNLKTRHKIVEGPTWSIMSFGEKDTGVRKNVIYDSEGSAIAQVDFGHGSQIGIHVHALVSNNLEHAATNTGEHCFELHDVPWPWLCIPDLRARTAEPNIDEEKLEALGLPLSAPPHTLDMDDGTMPDGWIPVELPFEDYMGDRMFSTDSV